MSKEDWKVLQAIFLTVSLSIKEMTIDGTLSPKQGEALANRMDDLLKSLMVGKVILFVDNKVMVMTTEEAEAFLDGREAIEEVTNDEPLQKGKKVLKIGDDL